MTLSDGRVVKGKFQCMDRLRNFILVDAEETRMVAITPGARAGDRARFEKIARPLSLTPRVSKNMVPTLGEEVDAFFFSENSRAANAPRGGSGGKK